MPQKEHRRTVKQEAELEALVREQQADMRLGSYQPKEKHVAFSLDATSEIDGGSGAKIASVAQFLTDGTTLRMPYPRDFDGCPVHGRNAVEYRGDNGSLFCRECKREGERLRYATNTKMRERHQEKVRQFRAHQGEEYKARDAAYSRAYRARKKAERERAEAAKEDRA